MKSAVGLGFVHGSGGGGGGGADDAWMRAFGAVRIAWGAVLVSRPALVLEALGGKGASRAGWPAVARVLGARHVLQGAATLAGAVPGRAEPVLAVGIALDLAHAASSLGLALVSPRQRRLSRADAVVALWLALAGAALAQRLRGD